MRLPLLKPSDLDQKQKAVYDGIRAHVPVLLSPERPTGRRRGAPRRCRPRQGRDRGAARHRSQAR